MTPVADRPARRWLGWGLGLAAALILLLATGVGLFRLATRMVPGYRVAVEHWVSGHIGFPMKIGTMSARWHGLGPELVLHSVALESLGPRRVLAHAHTVDVRLSLPVLLEKQRIMPSGIVISGLHLAFSENAKGQLRLPHWMRSTHATPTLAALLATLTGDLRFELRQAVVTLKRPARAGGSVVLTLERLVLRADDNRYRLQAEAKIHPGLRGALTLAARARGPRRSPAKWRWQARVIVSPVRIHALGLLPRSLAISRGVRAGLDAEIDGVGRMIDVADGEVSLQSLFTRSPKGSPQVGYSRADFHFVMNLPKRTLTLAPFVLERPGKPAVSQTLTIGWRGPIERPTAFEIASSHLILGAFEPLWTWDRRVRGFARWAGEVSRLDPKGTVSNLDLVCTIGGAGIRPETARGRFRGVGWRPLRPIPGLRGLKGRFTFASRALTLTLLPSQSSFTAPWLFDHPIRFHFGGSVLHERSKQGTFTLTGTPSRIVSHGLNLAVGAITLTRSRPHGEPILALSASGHNIDVREAARDLPLGIFHPRLVHWFRQAFVSGVITRADFVFRGPPARFPFTRGGGLFRVRFALGPAELHIAPGWPDLVIQKAAGAFVDAGLFVHIGSGDQAGLPLAGDLLTIPDLGKGVLSIVGRFHGSGTQLLGYLDSTPLSRRWGGLFTNLAISGPLTARVRISLPVKALTRVRIQGTAHLLGVRLRFAALPPVTHLEGVVDFDNLALKAPLVTGMLAGHRITVNAWMEDAKTNIQLVGALASRLLAPYLPPTLAQRIHGHSMWRGVIDYAPRHLGGPVGFTLRSDLVGTSLHLPAPMGKVPAIPIGIDWAGHIDPSKETFAAHGSWGSLFSVRLAGQARRGRLRLQGMRIVFGTSLIPPPARGLSASGLSASGQIGIVDLAGWWALGRGLAGGSLPWRIRALLVDHLTGWGQNLPEVTVNAHSTPGATVFSIAGPNLAGEGTLPIPAHAEPMRLNFSRIELAPLVHLVQPGSQPPNPDEIPALDLTSARTDYGKMHLGQVTLVLRDAGTHTLLIPRFKMKSPDLDVTGAGRWSRASGHSRVVLSLRLTSGHLSRAFRQLALTPPMTAHNADVTLALHWHGLPWHPDPESVGGQIGFRFKNGRVFSLKPGGAGRFIALFSLNALPRRLGLDFSDVFSRGLAYDQLTGDFALSRGVARTRNVELFGPSIALWMTGEANLAKRSYDQVALVVPHVGSTLPIAGMIFGGPVGGGIMLAVSRIFQGLIENMTEAYYHISGSWSHPVVKRIGDEQARALGFVKPHP